jgi:hypothetical protein
MKIDKVSYFNQPNCCRLSNGTVEVIATTDIGPRIICYRYIGGENILAELGQDVSVETELGGWKVFGGHRLWHAPEIIPRSYVPDNDPVHMETIGEDTVVLTQHVEPATHIEKQIMVHLASDGSCVTLTHRLTNKGLWPIELAPWGLSVMNGGGTTIIPNEPYKSHDEALLPARPMVLWHYTDLSDPRFTLGSKFVRLRTDVSCTEPQKMGAANKRGWAAYLRGRTLFVKKFPYLEGIAYPDCGCNFETYTAGNFMEIESLGPMAKLEPEGSIDHVERWWLFEDVNAGSSESDLESAIMPLIQSAS